MGLIYCIHITSSHFLRSFNIIYLVSKETGADRVRREVKHKKGGG